MPSYVIHLCVAKKYIERFKVENENEFVQGVIYPDSVCEKWKTHYSKGDSAYTNLYEFLVYNKLNSSYNEGYFLHLLCDYLFYNKYFLGWKNIDSEILYNDYDILNSKLIQKYNLTQIPKGLEKYFGIDKEGETVEYHFDKVIKFIEEVSNYELHKLAKKILQKKDAKFLLE